MHKRTILKSITVFATVAVIAAITAIGITQYLDINNTKSDDEEPQEVYEEPQESLVINNPGDECLEYTQTCWAKEFSEYLKANNMKEKVDNLKKGLDNISKSYVNQFMRNTNYYDRCINLCKHFSEENTWSEYDKILSKKFETMTVPEFYNNHGFNPYIYKSLYGMSDLPPYILKQIDGKDIIDLGSYPGDTVYTFHKYFPNSNIYAFEPVLQGKEAIDNTIQDLIRDEGDYNTYLIHSVQKGIGDHSYVVDKMEYDNNISYNVPIVTIDEEYPKIGNNNPGLIKMDIEGAESSAVKGAVNTIKKYKPVLVIAIYHTPEDFFEMKDKLKALNPNYKFMIRRTEDLMADADLVLIAY